jgi:hypothetical protein
MCSECRQELRYALFCDRCGRKQNKGHKSNVCPSCGRRLEWRYRGSKAFEQEHPRLALAAWVVSLPGWLFILVFAWLAVGAVAPLLAEVLAYLKADAIRLTISALVLIGLMPWAWIRFGWEKRVPYRPRDESSE